jgi:ABC-type antimicrobial peptide transport system permease subunit
MCGRAGMSGYFSYYMGLRLEDKFFVVINDKSNNIMQLVFQSGFFLKSSPSLQMTNQPSSAVKRNMIVPMNVYVDLLKKSYAYFKPDNDTIISYSYKDIPISQLLLKVDEKIPTETFNQIYDIFDNDPDINVSVWSYQEFATNIDNTNRMVNFLFGFVNIIVFIFCFFNLSASMSINIFEQTKEITIYRALGISKNYLIFIYISEAFILILSSSFVGLIIGTILSWTMTLQRVLFTNLPLTFDFPYGQLIAVFIASIVGSFLCTIFPARKILNMGIAEIMKLG